MFHFQISACIPFLRLTSGSPKIVFYCHFPDQLLTQRKSLLKSLYRKPIDWFEEKTTGMADSVLVNSKFTGKIFFLLCHQGRSEQFLWYGPNSKIAPLKNCF